MKFILFILITSLVTIINGQRKIINGVNAVEGKFSYQVFLVGTIRNPDGTTSTATCGGSIIHKRWILTAAHCLYGRSNVITYAGSTKVSTMLKLGGYSAYKTFTHELFSGTEVSYSSAYDIGLIRLSTDLPFNQNVRSIKIATNDNIRYEYYPGIMSGFGLTDFNNRTIPDDLKYAVALIINHEECKRISKPDWIIYDSQICTSTSESVGACSGDSGGPLVVGDTLVGVISFSDKYCKTTMKPNIFVRVSSFFPWIKQKLNLFDETL